MSMSTIQSAAIESGNRIQLPADWVEALGLRGLVTLERTDNGILIRPSPRFTWDDIFATRLSIQPGDAATAPTVTDLSGDDLLF
jgi:antitoxin component of MazEF toxin-antitoxin module